MRNRLMSDWLKNCFPVETRAVRRRKRALRRRALRRRGQGFVPRLEALEELPAQRLALDLHRHGRGDNTALLDSVMLVAG